MTVVRFPIPFQQRLNQWDATHVDLGPCVHDDCDQPAMFYLTHWQGNQPRIKFDTGKEALRLKEINENSREGYEEIYGRPKPPPPLVCGDCAHGALAALIAYGS